MTTFTLQTIIYNKSSWEKALQASQALRTYGYDIEELLNIDTTITFKQEEYVWSDGEKETEKTITFNIKDDYKVTYNLDTKELA